MGIKLVDPRWIGASGLEVRIIDVRRRVDYEDGHIPGASSLPVTVFVKSIGRLKDAPEPKEFEELMSRLGVKDDSLVLAYDDQWGVYAARLLWTLELYGHKDLYLLDRNFSIYVQDGGQVSRDAPKVERSVYTARMDERWLSTKSSISKVLKAASGLVVDAGERMDFLNGHMPGAVNLPWRMCIGKDRNFLPEERLKQIFKEHGVAEGTEVTSYCKDGMTSSYIYAALRILGYEKVRLYSRGYAEWEESKQPIVAEFQELMGS